MNVRENRSYILAVGAMIIVFLTYQFALTPDQRASVNRGISDISRAPKAIATMAAQPTAIILVPTAPAVARPTVVPVIKPATNPIGGTLDTSVVAYAQVGVNGCFVATAPDGHQLCSDGRSLAPSDARSLPDYCADIRTVNDQGQSLGGATCSNGTSAGILMPGAVSDAQVSATIMAQPEYQQAQAAAQSAQGKFRFENECVTATRPEGVEQTVCNPDPKFPWSQDTAAGVAATIIDGSLPANATKGAHG